MNESLRRIFMAMERLRVLIGFPFAFAGMHRGEFMTLCSIADFGLNAVSEAGECVALTVSQLSKMHEISPAGMSQLLNGLEKKGYISRKHDEMDRRRVRVHLTQEGMRAVERAKEQMVGLLGNVVERLGEEDAAQLARLLEKMHGIVGKLIEESNGEAGSISREGGCIAEIF